MDQIIVETVETSPSKLFRIILIGAAAVLIYDTVASLLSIQLSLPYPAFALGSILIYFFVGFFAARKSRFTNALVAVFFVELVDVTLGWAISWHLGPGRVAEGIIIWMMVLAALSLFPFAFFFGSLGGLVSRWI